MVVNRVADWVTDWWCVCVCLQENRVLCSGKRKKEKEKECDKLCDKLGGK